MDPKVIQKLMEINYYGKTGATSVKKLYEKMKNRGVTMQQVKDFIDKQEVQQVFKIPKRKINYFPIYAPNAQEVYQADLIDMSDIASANHGYCFILACIDVFSRVAYCVLLKNKESSTVAKAMEEILKEGVPKTITTDMGSEFISKEFKNIMEKYNIEHVVTAVGNHKVLGKIDRFTRTLRERINKYLLMHNTTKYYKALPDIIEAYNNTYHSAIKKDPMDVKKDDQDVKNQMLDQYLKAKNDEVKFKPGDRVRYITNFKQFEKRSNPKWSKVIHTIKEQVNPHSYLLYNGAVKIYYELQKVNEVEKLQKPQKEPTREQIRADNRKKRTFKKSGLDKDDIMQEKRKRKPIQRLNL